MAASGTTRGARARTPVCAGGTAVEPDSLSVRALARGLSILSLFDVDHREWTIDEIAEKTGLLRMTAYRMVRTLEAASFLVRDRATNHYHVGPAALALSYVSDGFTEFVDVARPFLEALAEETGESVTLAIEVDDLPVCVDFIDTTRPFQRLTAPGRIIGDLASVHGKIFAAFKPAGGAGAAAGPPAPAADPQHRHRPGGPRRGARTGRTRRGRLRRRRALPQPVRRRCAGTRPDRGRGRGDLRGDPRRPLRRGRAQALHRGRQAHGHPALHLPRLERRLSGPRQRFPQVPIQTPPMAKGQRSR